MNSPTKLHSPDEPFPCGLCAAFHLRQAGATLPLRDLLRTLPQRGAESGAALLEEHLGMEDQGSTGKLLLGFLASLGSLSEEERIAQRLPHQKGMQEDPVWMLCEAWCTAAGLTTWEVRYYYAEVTPLGRFLLEEVAPLWEAELW